MDTSIFVHQLTHPLRSRVVLFTTLNSFQLFKKKEVLPCHQEGKKGLMSCKNYANGMEDYTLGVVYEIFFFAYVIIFFNRCQEEVPGHHTDGLTQQHPTHGHCRRRRQCFSMPLLCLLLYINPGIIIGLSVSPFFLVCPNFLGHQTD